MNFMTKLIRVEAYEFKWRDPVPNFLQHHYWLGSVMSGVDLAGRPYVRVHTSRGGVIGHEGDWIVAWPNSTISLVPSDVFHTLFEGI